jgi:hypothetical protein
MPVVTNLIHPQTMNSCNGSTLLEILIKRSGNVKKENEEKRELPMLELRMLSASIFV